MFSVTTSGVENLYSTTNVLYALSGDYDTDKDRYFICRLDFDSDEVRETQMKSDYLLRWCFTNAQKKQSKAWWI